MSGFGRQLPVESRRRDEGESGYTRQAIRRQPGIQAEIDDGKAALEASAPQAPLGL